jgi:aspartyl protease family protein
VRAALLAALAPALALALAGAAAAQSVSMAGSLGRNALLVIDGKTRTVAVGATVDGVKVLAVSAHDTVVELQGKRVTLVLGGAQVNLGGKASEGAGSTIVLTAGSGGHFVTDGQINGRAVRFVVDTGATTIALSEAEAERIGLDWKKGRRGHATTANGVVAVHQVFLSRVRVGDVQVHDVEAVVVPAGMAVVLLGNSFLSRFQMRRENDRMTLERRY